MNQIKNITCITCKNGEAELGETIATYEKNNAVVVIKGVPAYICTNCGEKYFDDKTTERVLEIAKNAFKAGAEVEICRYNAA